MASGERAASGAQLLFGGSYLTSALARTLKNAASSSAPAAQRANAEDSEHPRRNLPSARALSAPGDCNPRPRNRNPPGPSPFARNRGMSPLMVAVPGERHLVEHAE